MNIRKPKKNPLLDDAIESLLLELKGHDGDSDGHAKIVTQLTELYALKEQDKTKRLSKDTLVTVLGNLLGIAVIVKHEELNIITSKALAFIRPTKIN